MSTADNDKKRKYMATYREASSTIPQGQSLINVILVRVKDPVITATYKMRTLVCKSIEKCPIPVMLAAPSAKRKKKGRDDSVADEESAAAPPADHTVIQPGDEFACNCFDPAFVPSMKATDVLALSVLANWHEGRWTFKAQKAFYKTDCFDALTPSVFRKSIVSSGLAEVPTRETFGNVEFGTRAYQYFILPLTNECNRFKDICICSISSDTEPTNLCLTSGELEPIVGVNCENGDGKSVNRMVVAYEPVEKSKPNVAMSFNFLYPTNTATEGSIFEVFGVADLELWRKVGARMILNASEWFAYGYSDYSRIMSMRENMSYRPGSEDATAGDYALAAAAELAEAAAEAYVQTPPPSPTAASDDESTPKTLQTTGLVLRMNLNLPQTVARAGVKLSLDFVTNFFNDYTFGFDRIPTRKTLNTGYRARLKTRGCVINLSELADGERSSMLGGALKEFDFYGVFPSEVDEPSQFEGEQPALEEMLLEKEIKPAVIFAVKP